MKAFREKCEKPPFLGILGQNAPFGQFLAKMGETGFFWNIFPPLQALTNCKVSEKVMNRFQDISERTDERTRAKFKVLMN